VNATFGAMFQNMKMAVRRFEYIISSLALAMHSLEAGKTLLEEGKTFMHSITFHKDSKKNPWKLYRFIHSRC
jgi:hypothetical protein